ncbi:MAG TPA: hypothetical protein VM785_11400 [Gaiellales bacterium]|nr:hypothetical protein [Gaiellales bacterium]
MGLRREMTVRRGLQALLRWWWLIALCTVACGLLAWRAAGDTQTTYSATRTVNLTEFQPGTSIAGFPIPVIVPSRTLPNAEQFLVPDVARTVATAVRLPPMTVLKHLNAKVLTPTQIQFTATAAKPAVAAASVSAYAEEFVRRKQEAEYAALRGWLPARTDSTYAARQARSAIQREIAAVPSQINAPQGPPVQSHPPAASPASVTLAGVLGGLVLGALLAVGLTAFEPRVRRASEIKAPDHSLFPVSRDGVAALRANLELTAFTQRGGVIAVSPPDGGDGAASLARSLSASFAAAGLTTTLVMLDRTPGAGARSFLDGSDDRLVYELAEHDMRVVHGGTSSLSDDELFTAKSVRRLLTRAKQRRHVVIVQTGDPATDPPSLLAVGLADAAVLVVNRSTRWRNLDRAADRVQTVAETSLRICFDRPPRARRADRRVAHRTTLAGVEA